MEIAATNGDESIGKIVYAPYQIRLRDVKAGKHILKLKVYLSSVNCFGALHCCTNGYWIGPIYWYTKGTGWAYEHQLKETGILKSPVIEYSAPERAARPDELSSETAEIEQRFRYC